MGPPTKLPTTATQRPHTRPLRLAWMLLLMSMALSHPLPASTASASLQIYVDGKRGNDQWSGGLPTPNTKRTDGPLQRVQSAYDRVSSADTTIYVKEGTYREEIRMDRPYRVIIRPFPDSSGRPIISGAEKIPTASWKKCGATTCADLQNHPLLAAIHYVDLPFQTNQIFQNDVPLPRSRYPETGYLYPHQGTDSTRNTLEDPVLKEMGASLTGAICHVRTRPYLINHMTVLSHDAGRVTLAGETKFPISHDSGYFLTNLPSGIRRPGQWAFDSAKNRLYLYPAAGLESVEASQRDHGFLTTGQSLSSHEISGFSIQKTNKAGIWIRKAAGFSLVDNLIEHAFLYGIHAAASDRLRIEKNHIRKANSIGIYVGRDSENATISDNAIYATGAENYGDDLVAGRGVAIFSYSGRARIHNNRIDRTGYDGIYLGGNVSGVDVAYNHISNVMLSLADGGAIYTGGYSPPPLIDRIHHNIIEHAHGYSGGVNRRCVKKSMELCRGGAHGIYLDERSSQRVIENNAVINASSGVFLHWGGDNRIESNLLFDNRVSQAMLKGRDKTEFRLRNNTFTNNILFAREKDQKTLSITADHSGFSFAAANNNYFLSPYTVEHISVQRPRRSDNLSLRDWESLTGYDVDSRDVLADSPRSLDYTRARVLLNPSLTEISVALEGATYCDLRGMKIGASARLLPFQATLVVPCDH